ncbi:type VII secretion-associated serine protease mycosin [Mycobacterium sp. LTG2003]
MIVQYRFIAATFAVLPLVAAPLAGAVVPPAIDDAFLPPPAPPAATHRTEQREQCFDASSRDVAEPRTALDLDAVWRLSRGSGQTVAVIDTGVTRHRFLPHLVGGGDYVSSGDGTADCDGHGTIVAGIIGGAEADGFSGVAPAASILAIRQSSNKFAGADGSLGVGDVDTLARAVRTAADLGATVINISSVACVTADDPLDDRALGASLAYAVDVKNVVVVAAAGNVGGHCREQNPPGQPDWDTVVSVATPAWYDDLVLCVGSVSRDGTASTFSLGGPWVDVAAPGEGMMSLHPDGARLIDTLGKSKPISGTSYAAPIVSGIAALVRSRFPHLHARDVMRRIEDTAHRPPGGWNPYLGHGVIDPLAAVSDGGAPTAAPVPVAATSIAQPAVTTDDARSRRVAFGGAAACVAVTALLAMALSAMTRRLRHPVTRD